MPTFEDIFPPRPTPQRLCAADIVAVAAMDPSSSYNHGQLSAFATRSTDPTDPARALIDALREVPTQPQPGRRYRSPAIVPARPGGDLRPLEESDREWLRRLPTDPAAVSAADAATLATMVAQAASAADLRLLATYFEPLWQHHDAIEQRQGREEALRTAQRSSQARTRRIEDAAIAALTASVAATFPDLRPYEAKARATEQLSEAWAAKDAALAATIYEARQPPVARPMPGLDAMSALDGRESSERAKQGRQSASTDFLSSLR